MSYRIRLVFRNDRGQTAKDWFKNVPLDKKFDTLKSARAYAIMFMDSNKEIFCVEVSNPKYKDVWQVATEVRRTRDGGYFWYAIRSRDTVGAGHYLNKDGTISKRIFLHYFEA